jgi:hypothetical protein
MVKLLSFKNFFSKKETIDTKKPTPTIIPKINIQPNTNLDPKSPNNTNKSFTIFSPRPTSNNNSINYIANTVTQTTKQSKLNNEKPER